MTFHKYCKFLFLLLATFNASSVYSERQSPGDGWVELKKHYPAKTRPSKKGFTPIKQSKHQAPLSKKLIPAAKTKPVIKKHTFINHPQLKSRVASSKAPVTHRLSTSQLKHPKREKTPPSFVIWNTPLPRSTTPPPDTSTNRSNAEETHWWPASSRNMSDVTPSPLVITLNLGVLLSSGGQTQTLLLTPQIQKSYIADRASPIGGIAEIFIGKQDALFEHLDGQGGIAIGIGDSGKLSGNIWDDADSEFNNYTYNYQVLHEHILLKGKLLGRGYFLSPWVSAGVGIGFNQGIAYDNIPIIYAAVKNSNFSTENEFTFTYTLGIGLQKEINASWEAGVGYEFSSWGKSALGRAQGQTMNSGLTISNMYINEIFLSVSYIY